MCLPQKLKNQHKCVEKTSRTNCPFCMEDIHTSRIPSHIPLCGHLIHKTCIAALFQGGFSACLICQAPMKNAVLIISWTTMLYPNNFVSPLFSNFQVIWCTNASCWSQMFFLRILQQLGNLQSLVRLNVSHNALTSIPSPWRCRSCFIFFKVLCYLFCRSIKWSGSPIN